MGFPTRPERDGFGPSLEDERPVENPRRELGASVFRLAWWQLAGMGRTVQRGTLVGRWDGFDMQTDYQAFAWDPEGALPLIVPTRAGAGDYLVTLDSEYPDETDTPRPIEIAGVAAFPQPAAPGGPFLAQARLVSATQIEVRVWDMSGAPALADVPFLLTVW